MTKKQKTLVSLLRAFVGYYGVDAFVMKKTGKAITTLVIGVVLEILSYLLEEIALSMSAHNSFQQESA